MKRRILEKKKSLSPDIVANQWCKMGFEPPHLDLWSPLWIALIHCFPRLEKEQWSTGVSGFCSKLTSPSGWFPLKPQDSLGSLPCFFLFPPLEFCSDYYYCCCCCLCQGSLVEIHQQRALMGSDFFRPSEVSQCTRKAKQIPFPEYPRSAVFSLPKLITGEYDNRTVLVVACH